MDRLGLPNPIRKSASKMMEFILNIIQEKKTNKGQDVISKLVHAGDQETGVKLTTMELVGDIYSFFIAGHETTATILTFAVAELALNQDVQDRLYKEITQKVGQKIPTYDEIRSLEYLHNFLSENLRLHTPIGLFFTRRADRDLYYDPDGNHGVNGGNKKRQFIPKGTLLSINYHSIHRDPTIWENPEKFNPDRFLPENVKGRHQFAYIPFAGGSRVCVGMNYSLMQQKIFIGRLLQKWKIVPNPTEIVLQYTKVKGYGSSLLLEPPNVKVNLIPRFNPD